MTPGVLAVVEHGTFSWWAVAATLALLVANGFFVAVEISLLAARRARIEERAEAGDPRAVQALAALQELSITFSGAQLGITMASLGLGAIAEPAAAALLERALDLAGLPARPRGALAFAIGLAIVVLLHMVVGEMAPKNLALGRAEDVSLRLARTFRVFVIVLRPLIVALNWTANALVRMVGIEPVDDVGLVHTPQELLLALRESRRYGTVSAQDARVLTAALRLSEIDAELAMTPRVDLVALPAGAPIADVLDRAGDTGFTRFPVYGDDLDDIIGIVHVKDVLIADDEELAGRTVSDMLRPVLAVPESRDLEHLLGDMRADRAHAVLVVDEFGGTAGMLTFEERPRGARRRDRGRVRPGRRAGTTDRAAHLGRGRHRAPRRAPAPRRSRPAGGGGRDRVRLPHRGAGSPAPAWGRRRGGGLAAAGAQPRRPPGRGRGGRRAAAGGAHVMTRRASRGRLRPPSRSRTSRRRRGPW